MQYFCKELAGCKNDNRSKIKEEHKLMQFVLYLTKIPEPID